MLKIASKTNINDRKFFKIMSVATLFYINFLMITIFLMYFRTKMILTNPLIASETIDISFESYARKGILLTSCFPLLLALKFFNKNVAVVIGSYIVVMIYMFM